MKKPILVSIAEGPVIPIEAVLLSIGICEKMGISEKETLRILKQSLEERLNKTSNKPTRRVIRKQLSDQKC
jgi:hypothetical protein